MELQTIIERIDVVPISKNATITQLKHEEDDEFYQVWKIQSGAQTYILKESKGDEGELYATLLSSVKGYAPTIYQVFSVEEKTYLLMEYIEGENLCRCDREKLVRVLDALIGMQKQTWETKGFGSLQHLFDKSLAHRRNRGKYLNDERLEKAYEKFLAKYSTLPKALCHDDLLPFNCVVCGERAVLIDWEVGGILPYPTSFARLIAHAEDDKNALFYMAEADKNFAIEYYYQNLLKEKGISYTEWLQTLEYFLFYEYCEWVFVGNKYNVTDGEYYKKYFPMAKAQAEKLLSM